MSIKVGSASNTDATSQADKVLADAVATGDKKKIEDALKANIDAYTAQYGDNDLGAYLDHLNWVSQDAGLNNGAPNAANWNIAHDEVDDLLGSSEFSVAAEDVSPTDNTKAYKTGEVPVQLYPGGKPVVSDANQGSIGDCNLVTTLAGLAEKSPSTITNAITGPDDKGNFQVKMYDPEGQPVSITVPKDAFLSKDGKPMGVVGKDGKANWASVMEAALSKYKQIYNLGSINAQASEDAVAAFTGVKNSYPIPVGTMSGKDAADKISSELAAGKVISGGFSKEGTIESGPSAGQQFVPGHGYLVMGVEVDAQGTQYVKMRNPWGATPKGDGMNTNDDGVIHVPLSQFEQLCDVRVISMDPKEAQAAQPEPKLSDTFPATDTGTASIFDTFAGKFGPTVATTTDSSAASLLDTIKKNFGPTASMTKEVKVLD